MDRESRIDKLVQSVIELHQFQKIEIDLEQIRREAEKRIDWHERGSNPNEMVNHQKHYIQ